MDRRATYVTDRFTSQWFGRRLTRLFNAAGVDVVITPEKHQEDPAPVVSGIWQTIDGVSRMAVMPLNEPLLPSSDIKGWKETVRIFITQASHMAGYLSSRKMNPSAIVDHPLCWMPKSPGSADLVDNRPIKFLLPCYGEWRSEHLSRFIPYLAAALKRDLGDLRGCEFVVEVEPFQYKPSFGELVTFYDDGGVFMHRLLRSVIVCCMAPSSIMEMSFLARMAPATGTTLFSEGLIDSGRRSTPQSVFEAFTRPSPYSHIKYLRAAAGVIPLDDLDMSPLFNFCSGSRTSQSTSAVMSPQQLQSVVSFVSGGRQAFNEQEVGKIIAEQDTNFATMVQKVKTMHEKLTK